MSEDVKLYWMLCLLSACLRAAWCQNTVVVRHRDERFSLSYPLPLQLPGSSRDLCAQACLDTPACEGSILHASDLCVLYRERGCPCPVDAVGRYTLGFSADPLSQADAARICKTKGMKLLAIESEQEHDEVMRFLNNHDPLHVGCYEDNSTVRAMEYKLWQKEPTLTNLRCSQACVEKGYRYSGTQAGRQCFCGGDHGFARYGESAPCTIPCLGDASETCGGNLRNQVTYSRCQSIWTSGWTPTPGEVGAAWQWNLTSSRARPFTFAAWGAWQPSTYAHESCMVLWEPDGYLWHDAACGKLDNSCYICECDKI